MTPRDLLETLAARHHGDGLALRAAAAQAGLTLRRIRPRGREWWRRDLGLVLAFDTQGRPLVLDTPQVAGSDLGDDAYAVRVRGRAALSPTLGLEAAAALVLGLAAQMPAAAPHRPEALAALALAALAGGLAEAVRRRAAARRLGRHSLDHHATLWDHLLALPTATVATLPPEACHHALADAAAAEAEAEKQRGHAVLGTALALPALAHLAWLSPPALAAAAATALVMAGMRLAALRRARRWRQTAAAARPANEDRLALAATALPELRLLGAAPWLVARAQDRLAGLVHITDRARWWEGAARLAAAAALALVPAAAWTAPQLALPLAALPLAQGAVILARALERAPVPAMARALLAARPEQVQPAPPPDRIAVLELEQVSHTYPGADRPALAPVSLRVAAGQVVAVAGPSGAGKSTLLRLALGLAEAGQGVVRINGRPLAEWDRAACRRRMAAVLQDEEIGIDTVRAVVLGMAPLPAEAAWEALRLTGLADEVAALPMGIQTLVTAGGFPAGMLQRLLIARALARAPDLLVLDEATAAMDMTAQTALFAALRARGTAVLVASHRPETLALADSVVTLPPLLP